MLMKKHKEHIARRKVFRSAKCEEMNYLLKKFEMNKSLLSQRYFKDWCAYVLKSFVVFHPSLFTLFILFRLLFLLLS